MQCREVQDLLSAYLDCMLDPSEKESADRHLEGCPACRSELDDLKMVVGLVRDLPLVDPPPEFGQGLRRRLEQAARPGAGKGILPGLARGRWSGILALAAGFLLVVGLAADWYGIPGKFSRPDRGVRVESSSVAEKAAPDMIRKVDPGDGQARDMQKDTAGYQASGQPAPDPVSGAPSGMGGGPAPKAVQKVSEASENTGSAPMISLQAVPDPGEEPVSVQDRKLATNGASGVTARGTAAVPPPEGSQQPMQACLEVKVPDRTAAIKEVMAVTQKLGGFAAVLPDGKEIILRVPVEQFEKAVADIGKTGRVIRQEYPPEDVDLLKSIAQRTGISPEALELEKLGRGGGGAAGSPQPGAVVPPAGSPPAPAGVLQEKKADQPAGSGTVQAMSTIRVRIE